MGAATKEKVTHQKYDKRRNIFLILTFIFFCIVITLRPLSMIWNLGDKFFSSGYAEQYESYKKAYYGSQYIIKKNPGIIPDETFESFAAGAFLRGVNPILIVHDHPPLGRYILSLSILLFDNPHTIILFLLTAALFGIFLLTHTVTGNIFLSLIPVGLYINEPLFLNKLIFTPLPEPIQLPFIIFSFYFFIRALHAKNDWLYFVITSILLGVVISTRFFVTGGVIVAAMAMFLLLHYRIKRKTILFAVTLPLSLLVLIASYTRTILDGYSIFQVFSIQKYILFYHKSKFILPFTFWDLLLFNRWHTWWGNMDIIRDSHWIISWPVATLLSAFALVLELLRKISFHPGVQFLLLWLVLQTVVLSTGYTSTRYFLPLLPMLYIVATVTVYEIAKATRVSRFLSQ